MTIYLIMFSTFSLITLLVNLHGKNETAKKRYIVFAASITFLPISALRSINVGADTYNYSQIFNNIVMRNLSGSVQLINERAWLYAFYNELLGLISSQQQTIIISNSVLIFILFVVFTYQVSETSRDMYLYWLYYFCFGFFFFSMSGMRQTISMMLLLNTFAALFKRRTILSLILFLLAVSVHITSLIFIAFFVFYYLNGYTSEKKTFFLMLVSLPIVFTFIPLMKFLTDLLNLSYSNYFSISYKWSLYTGSSGRRLFFGLFYLMLILIFLYYRNKSKTQIYSKAIFKDNEIDKDIIKINSVLYISYLAAVMSIVFSTSQTFARFEYFFYIFSGLLIINFVNKLIKLEFRSIVHIIFVLVFFFTYAQNMADSSHIYPYMFFWQ
jgi:hypothetical protein